MFMYIFTFLNIILWISYIKLKVGIDDFGKVPKKFHVYLLLSASIAYLFNLIHVNQNYDSGVDFQIAASTYYLLQMFFIPAVRYDNGNITRILLLICVIPISYLFWKRPSALSLAVVLHVAINDFLFYGFSYDGTIALN